MGFLLSPNTYIGAAFAAALVGGYMVLSYGPDQYQQGGIATAARLDAATNVASKEIADGADRAEFLMAQCRARGGLYNFADSVCVEGPAD